MGPEPPKIAQIQAQNHLPPKWSTSIPTSPKMSHIWREKTQNTGPHLPYPDPEPPDPYPYPLEWTRNGPKPGPDLSECSQTMPRSSRMAQKGSKPGPNPQEYGPETAQKGPKPG